MVRPLKKAVTLFLPHVGYIPSVTRQAALVTQICPA
nr:MAG TPA: hypothetical protein [Caudoviricetes sp.]